MNLDPIPEMKDAAKDVLNSAATALGNQLAGALPALAGYTLVIRISLEKNP